MFGDNAYAFDASKIADMFKPMDMTKMFDGATFDPTSFKGFDQAGLMAAQQKNMSALVAAQQAAAAGYQDLFEKQVAIFQETMTAAQEQISELTKAEPNADSAAKQTALTTKAFESAVANAQALADAAHKANADAYEIVRARVETSIEELKASMKS